MTDEFNRREFIMVATLGLVGAGMKVSGADASVAKEFDGSVNPLPASSVPQVKVDAFVANSWNGILFVIDDATGFQVRVGTRLEGSHPMDGDDIEQVRQRGLGPAWEEFPRIQESVTEVGPHSPDGSYCRLCWNQLFPYDTGSRICLEWSRLDVRTVLGRVTYDYPFVGRYWNGICPPWSYHRNEQRTADVLLEAYSPLGFRARYGTDGNSIAAHSVYQPTIWETEWNNWRFNFSCKDPLLNREKEPGFKSGFFKPEVNESNWRKVRWGAYWQEDPFIDARGFGWYRRQVLIPREIRGRQLRLDLGKISQDDWTYLNGELIGFASGADSVRQYSLTPGTPAYTQIRWGEINTISVQVCSAADLGGISSGPYDKVVRSEPPGRPKLSAIASHEQGAHFILVTDRRANDFGVYKELTDLRTLMQDKWELGNNTGEGCAGLLFRDLHMESMQRGRDNQLYFVAMVGFESESLLAAEAMAIIGRKDLSILIEERKEDYEARRVRADGGLVGAAEMITNTAQWAVLYAPEQKRTFVVDSRRWCRPDKWILFGNSAVLTAWAAALENKQLGEDTLQGTLHEQLPDGKIMNAAGSSITTPDHSQDMYAAYAAWKIYLKWGDKDFLRAVYAPIERWHEWWFADRGDGQPRRDGNRNGLLELGNDMGPLDAKPDPFGSDAYCKHYHAAKLESYDDSPMWGYCKGRIENRPPQFRSEEGVRFDYKTSTLNLDCCIPNALYALSCDMLGRIARELGLMAKEAHFKRQYNEIRERINNMLWDESAGVYVNRFWEEDGGNFSYRKSAGIFYMMAAGVPDETKAKRLVHEHLLNPKEFWGEYVVPTIPRDDPSYPEQRYWRGAIWPPTNYLTYEGLKRYGYDDVAAQLAEKTYHLIKRNWDTTGALWENYSSITGKGYNYGYSARKHYSWSTALSVISVMECIDHEAWGKGLRFGSIGLSQQTRVENLPIRDHKYSVTVGPSLTELWRDGVRLFSTDTGAVIRDFEWDALHVTFTIKLRKAVESAALTVGGISRQGKRTPQVILNRRSHITPELAGSEVVFVVPAGTHLVEIIARD